MNSEKTLCIMGCFDPEANRAFYDFYQKLEQEGFPFENQPPHLTFGIYNNVNQDDLFYWVDQISRFQKKLVVNFNHLGLFQEGICFAEPCASLELLYLHRTLHAKFDQNCTDKNCLYSLKSKSWVPHTTLAVLEPEQLQKFVPIALTLFQPIQATIEKLVVTEYPPLKQIGEFPLLKQ